MNAEAGGGKARILRVHGGDDGNARLLRCAADGGAGEPEAPGVESGPGENEIRRERDREKTSRRGRSNQRDGLGGACFFVFSEKTVSRKDGADDFGIFLSQDFIEQYAGADGAGPGGYGMIAFLLAPDTGEELVQVVNDPKFTAHSLASSYEFIPSIISVIKFLPKSMGSVGI